MKVKPIRRFLLKEMNVGKFPELPPHDHRIASGQRGSGLDSDIWTRVIAEQTKYRTQIGSQRMIRPRKDGTRVTEFVFLQRHRVETMLFADQLLDQFS